jgi:hypothetical protein
MVGWRVVGVEVVLFPGFRMARMFAYAHVFLHVQPGNFWKSECQSRRVNM